MRDDLFRILTMKKTTLFLTFLIYTFSIFTEAGIMSSFIFEKTLNNHSYQAIEVSLKQAQNSFSGITEHSEKSGHCEGSICHIGHCHHVLMVSFEFPSFLIDISNTFSRKHDLIIAYDYSNKLKRPPRLS